MSPVIRLSDSIYKRLEVQAVGFDTPSNVIERLLDFYESRQKDSKKSNSASFNSFIGTARRVTKAIKKPRNPQKEKELKHTVGQTLNWGDFHLVSNSILDFQNSPKKVLCKYSSYSPEQNRWFWGVSQKYWTEWDNNFYLALLMENADHESYSFLLLEPKDALYLFTKCSESAGEKKINLRFYKYDGMPHLQEWKDYDVEKNTRRIKGI